MADTLDAFKVLQRADTRWANRHQDDPAPDTYLRHLLTALQPLLAPGTAPIDLDHATELEQLRQDVTEERCHRDLLLWLHAEATWRLEVERDRHAETIAERDARQEQRDDLRTENALLADQLATHQANAQHYTDTTAAAAGSALNLLGRLVDAINEEWHPNGDHNTQVDRALLLVAAAVDQLGHRADTGQHVHTYPISSRTGRPGPCACRKRFPRAAKPGPAGKKGVAA